MGAKTRERMTEKMENASEKYQRVTDKAESGSEKYRRFRREYPEFIYHSYQAEEAGEELKVSYFFEIPGLAKFHPTWRFPKGTQHKTADQKKLLMNILFSLGMVELVSYWKITCSPRVIVKAGNLCTEQIEWWKNLYFHGLGEFFYVNGIDEARMGNFMEMVVDVPEGDFAPAAASMPEASEMNVTPVPAPFPEVSKADFTPVPKEGCRVLVPIGGGKDSAVTLELLKEAKADIRGYIINPRGATTETAKAAGLEREKVVSVYRTLDKAMLDLNQKGFLNGHTPFSAIVAFSSLAAAALDEVSYIALSNESSANESTIQGSTVNHQYSKSFRFEKDFHDYARRYLPGSAYYFSMLRPLSEFQIAGYFSACRAYHPIFRSCNVGSKTDVWCGHCPKCLFVVAILSPFLSQEELTAIFGKNIFEDESLWETLEQLTGIQEEKPFECVGSRREVNTALFLTAEHLEKEGKPLPALLAAYRKTPQYKEARQIGDIFSDYFDEENLVPAPWKKLVRKRCCKEIKG